MQDKIQEIMGLVDAVIMGSEGHEATDVVRDIIQSKLRELVRDQEKAKKYADMLAMCMFKKHYAQDEPYSSGAVKFELFDSLPDVISQIDNMASGLERANNITNTSN